MRSLWLRLEATPEFALLLREGKQRALEDEFMDESFFHGVLTEIENSTMLSITQTKDKKAPGANPVRALAVGMALMLARRQQVRASNAARIAADDQRHAHEHAHHAAHHADHEGEDHDYAHDDDDEHHGHDAHEEHFSRALEILTAAIHRMRNAQAPTAIVGGAAVQTPGLAEANR